jgi:hypothetical protein
VEKKRKGEQPSNPDQSDVPAQLLIIMSLCPKQVQEEHNNAHHTYLPAYRMAERVFGYARGWSG